MLLATPLVPLMLSLTAPPTILELETAARLDVVVHAAAISIAMMPVASPTDESPAKLEGDESVKAFTERPITTWHASSSGPLTVALEESREGGVGLYTQEAKHARGPPG